MLIFWGRRSNPGRHWVRTAFFKWPIDFAPAHGQPIGRIGVEWVGLGQDHGAFARDPSQHRVDHAGGVLQALAAGQAHGQVDGRMIGNIEEQDLRRSGRE